MKIKDVNKSGCYFKGAMIYATGCILNIQTSDKCPPFPPTTGTQIITWTSVLVVKVSGNSFQGGHNYYNTATAYHTYSNTYQNTLAELRPLLNSWIKLSVSVQYNRISVPYKMFKITMKGLKTQCELHGNIS